MTCTLFVDVFLQIELEEGSDLPSVERAFEIFQGLRLAFARAVEKMDLWEHKIGQCIPEIKMEIVVEGEEDDWMEVTLGVERLRASQRLLREGNKARERAIVTKVYTWNINGDHEYGDDSEPVEDRYVFVE